MLYTCLVSLHSAFIMQSTSGQGCHARLRHSHPHRAACVFLLFLLETHIWPLKSHVSVLFLCPQGPQGSWPLGSGLAGHPSVSSSLHLRLVIVSAFAVILVEAGSYSQWLWGEFLGRQHPLCLLHPPLLCFVASVTLFSEACLHTSARDLSLISVIDEAALCCWVSLIPTGMTNVLVLCKYLCPQTDCSLETYLQPRRGKWKAVPPPKPDLARHGTRSFCLSIVPPSSLRAPSCLPWGVYTLLFSFYIITVELIVFCYRHCPQTFK